MSRILGLAVLGLVVCSSVAGCGGSNPLATSKFLVPKGDKNVLDDTYDRMLMELEHERVNDPAQILDQATTGQRLLYVVFFVDDEIGNGGLYQVYWNLGGDFIREAISAADRIGAHHWSALVRQAGAQLFQHGAPADVGDARHLIGCPDYCDHGKLDALTSKWRDGELRRPLRRYVNTHPSEFFAAQH